MKPRELENLGIGRSAIPAATAATRAAAAAGRKKSEIRAWMRRLVAEPAAFVADPIGGELARLLLPEAPPSAPIRDEPVPWRSWGIDLEDEAVAQMRNAALLPVSVRGALMPDAHVGYGLPVGGVLATEGAVIPYAVGVDIACRMRLTVLDMPAQALRGESARLARVLEQQTRFGVGATFGDRRDHDVLDRDWGLTPLVASLRDKAWAQLGTSGSGNHFVEFGTLTLEQADLGLPAGTHLALLSHSGSRGAGASIAGFYSRLASTLHPELPPDLRRLAWLDLDSEPGQEYWAAMSLMGEYAKANHEVIHRELLRVLGSRPLLEVENHHNFAWKEVHDGREVVVHRKGATPAGRGVLGVIPGSMATPGFVVRGRGVAASLESASHGAGRRMSRTAAARSVTWSQVKKVLAERGVTLLSAGIDEAPMVYKDILDVMRAQQDLVDVVARFDPAIVKMAPTGEPAED